MLQRDYILRIIEQIGLFLSRLLKLRQEDKLDDAYDLMQSEAQRTVGVSYQKLLQKSPEVLLQDLDEGTITERHLDALGCYFMTSGEICLDLKKDSEAIHHLKLALYCYAEAGKRFATYSFNRQVDLNKLEHLCIRAGIA